MDRYRNTKSGMFRVPQHSTIEANVELWVKESDVESLHARVRELEGLVQESYLEGFDEGLNDYSPTEGHRWASKSEAWNDSEAKAGLLKGTP